MGYISRMVSEFLKRFGINGVRLAKLTGQDPNTISRKLRCDQGLKLGAREAGVLACLDLMDDDQKSQVDEKFTVIMDQISRRD